MKCCGSVEESLKKCQRCMEVIIDAKERQAAEANKNATILLQEIDQEKVGPGISLLAVDFRKKLKQTRLS